MTLETATELAWHALIVGVLIGAWLTATLTSLYLYLRRPPTAAVGRQPKGD